MIRYRVAAAGDLRALMSIRLEMLREVNDLGEGYCFSDEFVNESRRFFLEGDQMTVLALEEDQVVGCASICYITLMPTFSHPTGKRAHLMNVYTRKDHRGQGIGFGMVSLLLEDAWGRGVTEISLDSTESGRRLYERCGFVPSGEGMVLVRERHG